jgi:hypothetical protein
LVRELRWIRDWLGVGKYEELLENMKFSNCKKSISGTMQKAFGEESGWAR